jgi:ketosteroid isomerase-like protein
MAEVSGTATGTGVTEGFNTLVHEWFAAVEDSDRDWVEAHLAEDFSDWLVPTGKPLPRKQFIDIQMGMSEFKAELLDLSVLETGGFVSAIYRINVREVFPDPADQSQELKDALDHGDLHDLLEGELLDPDSDDPVVINTVLRRRGDGELEVIHHMLVGRAV